MSWIESELLIDRMNQGSWSRENQGSWSREEREVLGRLVASLPEQKCLEHNSKISKEDSAAELKTLIVANAAWMNAWEALEYRYG